MKGRVKLTPTPPRSEKTTFKKPSLVALHMRTNDIVNSEVNKNLVADGIINIARECVAFGVKSVFISSLTVNN